MLLLTAFICCIALAAGIPTPQQYELPEITSNELEEDPETERLAEYLVYLLGADESEMPLLLIQDDQQQPVMALSKRSRYYRRYPWKRQNGRHYDPDGYLCSPSREDVFQLLIALHDARSGRGDRTVSFCNRRRPARAVFTNIRFLG
ncbi:hypothetical protein O3M35_005344 [Rhynocoris fuscipes]|uniref:Uncharacterized protein n=1 Tax=Rhynocoris fuscipes TaxID=488301 RepID=A0AAW1DID1_9HEMI